MHLPFVIRYNIRTNKCRLTYVTRSKEEFTDLICLFQTSDLFIIAAGNFQTEVPRSLLRETMVVVNGTELDVAGKTLSEYQATTTYDLKRIAVERNGEIVFKSQYDETVLEDGDRLEIVSFVGGG